MRKCFDVRGQSLPLVALLLWLMAATALLLVAAGERAVDQARAQAGADAVALSEAGAPGSGPTIATSNGVTIERLDRIDGVGVVVASGSGRAEARAELERPAWTNLDRRLQAGLARAEAVLGFELMIVSGYRSPADQERLWATRAQNPYPVARPGTSLHEQGQAVDVALYQAGQLAQISHLTGVCQPLPLRDPVHFTLCRTTPTR